MVSINCDMGEAFGIYSFGDDSACMPYVTHANVACGYHASDPGVMRDTVRAAKAFGIQVGAHPGLADREGFGRRYMKLTRRETADLVLYQTGALCALAAAEGVSVSHIKPHGALFGMAQNETEVAEGLADAAEILELPVIGFSDCCMSAVFTARHIPFKCEFYADLGYDDDGRQIISREHAAIDHDSLADRIREAVRDGTTRSVHGHSVPVIAESICVHSDTPDAVTVARIVHQTLMNEDLLAST